MAVISENIIKLLNYRISEEEYSSRLYQAISVCMNYKGYSGAASLFEKYSQEELKHAKWAYDFLLDLDIRPEVPALKAPPSEFKGLIEVLKMAYDHELSITSQCNSLAVAAQKENDFLTLPLAFQYMQEQKEEISKTVFWLDRIEVLGGEGMEAQSLYLLDLELGK